MATNPSQLLLLADHIKLSLLERQRAISLNLEPNSQDGHISRSLESLREGLEAIEKERRRLEEQRDPSAPTLKDQEVRLRRQYDDLVSQFHGFPGASSSSSSSSSSPPVPPPSITQPNDPSLASTFSHATSTTPTPTTTATTRDRPRVPSNSSFLKRSPNPASTAPKSVRFSDNPTVSSAARPRPAAEAHDDDDDETRAALFPYRDDPAADQVPDQHEHGLDNQQIHTYHTQVLREQDDQLDRLGESIGRQRDLSIQIGDELDGQVQLLDEVDGHVQRHQTRLDGARRRLGTVARRAKDNVQLTIIAVLIVVLVLLIVILK
ncbi:MAG: hypothetical protein M1816_005471 [Peltula sp. TS41687]|nr:MAG: hypothetical protein M1816_005471 [Peltula sp. TS41687]